MIAETTLEFFLEKIRSREPFAFSRWGDGEWRSVLGNHKPGKHNCDGHRYFPEMGQELSRVLSSRPAYLLGMQPLALKLFRPEIQKFLKQHKLQKLTWYNGNVFHTASIHGHLDKILAAVNERDVILVGPDHLKRLKPGKLPFAAFVDVPPKNAYLSRERIVRDVRAVLEKHRSALVAVSAGMPAELLIDDLWTTTREHNHTLIDFGSLWDPLVGVNSRTYHKYLKLDDGADHGTD